MYLELHIDNEDARYFQIKTNELLIGSLATCDAIVPVDGISKKHVKIIFFENKWFASDLGSTNGTYIDNDRLVPGSKKEIQINQYLRLGHNVYIAIVEDVDNDNEVPKPLPKPEAPKVKPVVATEDKTRVISLKDLKEAKAAPKAAAKKQEGFAASLKGKTVKRERMISTKTLVMASAVMLIGYILNSQFTKSDEPEVTIPDAAKEMIQKGASAADKVGE